MYQKFVITDSGELRFGKVSHHRDLLHWDESCPFGGGYWRVDVARGIVVLYGRSFEFGAPSFERLRWVHWEGGGVGACPLFYQPNWPYDENLVPLDVGY